MPALLNIGKVHTSTSKYYRLQYAALRNEQRLLYGVQSGFRLVELLLLVVTLKNAAKGKY